jgi:hypothetical protein
MKIPQGIIDFLVYLAPSLLIFLTAYLLIKKFLDTNTRIQYAELKRAIQKDLLPLRLQAYERIVLYLERISPNNLLARVYEPGMTVMEFHRALIMTIRSEFEHNITQQVYITNTGWAIVRNSRDELIRQINEAMQQCNPEGPGIELSKRIYDKMLKEDETPVLKAIDQIKNEAHQLF